MWEMTGLQHKEHFCGVYHVRDAVVPGWSRAYLCLFKHLREQVQVQQAGVHSIYQSICSSRNHVEILTGKSRLISELPWHVEEDEQQVLFPE